MRPGSEAGGPGAGDVRALLDALGGRPRPAGSQAEAEARAFARQWLEADGFTVREEPFSYSAFPGRWGTSLSGIAAIGVMGIAGHLASRGNPWIALATLAGGLGLIGALAVWLGRRGVLDAPVMRRTGLNLIASRGGTLEALAQSVTGEPSRWVMAHLDSKSQPVPILVRAAAITVSVCLVLASMGLAAAQGLGLAGAGWWPALTIATVIALLPVAASVVGARSDGAIDNASGCAAVLLAARSVPPDVALGVILTSAEELGLAGARAFALTRSAGTCVNCDGVDDGGQWTAMHTGARPEALLDAARRASARLGLQVTARRLLPGVLVDGVALADAGWQVVTISRGSVATLGRIHTPRDSRASLRGDAIPSAAALIAATVSEVR